MSTTRVNITPYFSVLFTLLLSLDLHGQAITMTPARAWIGQFNQQIKKSKFDFTKSSNLNMALPIGKIVSDQVDLKGQFHVNELQPESDQFKVTLSIDDAVVTARNVQIQIIIQKDIGFGSATLNLNATCGAINIRLKSPQVMNGLLDKNFQVKTILESLAKEVMTTEMVGCTGIAGLDQVVQEKVVDYIQTQLMSEQIHQIMSAEINTQLSKKISELAQAYLGDVTAHPQAHIRIDESFRLWSYIGENVETLFSPDEISSIAQNTKTSVLVKKAFLEKVLSTYLNKQLAVAKISSRKTPDLGKLTCSRWAQFFVWPSLRALPKCFDMRLTSRALEIKLVDPMTMKFVVKVQTWVQAPEQKKDIAYFLSTMNVSLVGLTAELTSFGGTQYPEFLAWAGHSSRMSTAPIQSAVEALLSAQVASLKSGKDADASLLMSWLKFDKIKSVQADSLSFELRN